MKELDSALQYYNSNNIILMLIIVILTLILTDEIYPYLVKDINL